MPDATGARCSSIGEKAGPVTHRCVVQLESDGAKPARDARLAFRANGSTSARLTPDLFGSFDVVEVKRPIGMGLI